MRLTYDDLAKERPELAKQILAQHIIPRANLREQDIFANSSSRVIGTAAGKEFRFIDSMSAWQSIAAAAACLLNSTEY